jgi:hypothetical protein
LKLSRQEEVDYLAKILRKKAQYSINKGLSMFHGKETSLSSSAT